MLLIVIFGTVLVLAVRNSLNEAKKIDFVDAAFLSIETFYTQCGNDKIESFSLRLISITLRITAIIVIACYGAVITSFLAVKIPKIPFKNVHEFLENGEYRLALRSSNNILEQILSVSLITVIFGITDFKKSFVSVIKKSK